MNESSLQDNMPTHKAVHKIGAKTILIKSKKQEESRISLIFQFVETGINIFHFLY